MEIMMNSLVDVMQSFGEALDAVKSIVADIENDMKQQKLNLEKCDVGTRVASNELGINHDFDERLSQLKEELKSLEKMKQNNSTSNASSATKDTGNSWSEKNQQPQARVSTAVPSECTSSQNDHCTRNTCTTTKEWWELDEVDEVEITEARKLNWTRERNNRERMKWCLKVSSGWNKKVTTVEDVERILREWTGTGISWTNEKAMYRKSDNLPIIYVKFKSLEERQTVIESWNNTNEFEGYLLIRNAMTKVETVEKCKTHDMSRYLKDKGYNVQVEEKNYQMKVNGTWWKYCFGNGWRKI